MYKVSQDYIDALSEKVYDDRISGRITFKDGTSMTVSDENLVKNSLKITKELCGSEYRIGSFNLACLKLAVFDESALEKDYSNAVITLSYYLKLKNGGEQSVPLGIFIADGSITSRKRDKVYITAYDSGMYFDCEPSAEIKAMTGTAPEIIEAICEECGVELGEIAEGLPNSEVVVSLSDKQIQTCRDAVMWCSALMCGYAVIDRDGLLNIISPKYSADGTVINTARSIGPEERNSIHSTDTRAYIKYLTAYSGGNVKQYTSEYIASDKQAAPASYAMTSNPLLTGKTEAECDEINKNWHKFIEMFKQRGVTARIFGDPAIDVGDSISFYGGDIDQRGNVIGIVTSYEWKYRNCHDIYCSAAECGEKISQNSETPTSKVRNQTEKRIDALSSSGATASLLSAVSFDKNRLYYNGETYYLQFGFNKRIMCVTKGKKYALLNSKSYNESCIEAATAVIKGLTEDWDLEFDNYALKNNILDISELISGYSGEVECDWGDGTVDNNISHTYTEEKRLKVRVKLLGDISGEQTINTGEIHWSFTNNPYFNAGIGASLYIGGKFEDVRLNSGNYVTHICFGENIKIVRGNRSNTSVCEKRFEIGIPPCIENFADYSFMYNAIDYIYIPETCKRIGNNAFYFNAASEIEIEEKGEELLIGNNAFAETSGRYGGYNRVDIAHVPARVKPEETNIYPFWNCDLTALRIGSGTTEIHSYFYNNADAQGGNYGNSIESNPYFIFLPSSITQIGARLINSSRQVYIIYGGSKKMWDSITKDSNWDGRDGTHEKITVICDYDLYQDYENVIRNYVRR